MNNFPQQNSLLFASFECYEYNTDLPVFPVALHWHYYGEILRVRSGALKIQRGDQTYILSAGDAVFMNPLVPHAVDFAEPGMAAEYVVIRADLEQFSEYFSYTPDLRGMLLEAEKHRLPMVFTARELHDRNMDMMIDQCVLEYKARQYGYDLRIHSLLYLIVIAVIRRWISGGFVPQNYNASIDPIFTLSSYIVHHIHEPLKVEDLAEYCGLSYPWFARKFHEIYGMSCKEYIEKVRVRRVEHFLQFTDCSLEYIRSHTGYVDCSHLVRDFRKHRGMTPGQFRKSCRQDAPGKDTFLKSIDTQEKNG